MTVKEADCMFDGICELEDVVATEIALSGIISHIRESSRQAQQLPCPSFR
jgi:hypothetical protein